MKKILIGSFVGAIILFGWQSISWTASGIHDDAYKYLPNQDEVIKTLSAVIPADGQYMIPRSKPGVSSQDEMAYNEQMKGKPLAIVTYHAAYNNDMVTAMVRGFLISFICVLLACFVVRRFNLAYRSFLSVFTAVLTFGVVSFLYVWYNQHNWFQTPWDVLWGEMIDCLVSWGLCGLWLGWLYSRKEKNVTM